MGLEGQSPGSQQSRKGKGQPAGWRAGARRVSSCNCYYWLLSHLALGSSKPLLPSVGQE